MMCRIWDITPLDCIPVIFSPKDVDPKAVIVTPDDQNKKSNVGTISYMPSMFGMFCASKVICDLLNT